MLDARQALEEHKGVFIGGEHLFISTQDKFLTGYVNCEVLFPHFSVMWDLVEQLIAPFLGEVEGFICPSTGDIVLAEYATIIANLQGFKTVAVWADKQTDKTYRCERNGFPQNIEGRKVLVLMDRISQGGTTRKVIAEARRCGAEVIGVAALSGVSSVSAKGFDVPELHTLCTIDVQAFEYDELPPELGDWPVVVDEVLGHGVEFKEKFPNYPAGFTTLLT